MCNVQFHASGCKKREVELSSESKSKQRYYHIPTTQTGAAQLDMALHEPQIKINDVSWVKVQ